MLHPVIPLSEQADFVEAFASVVSSSAGQVCETCGLERMGHGPESEWLGFDPHEWQSVPTDAAGLERAAQLTSEAYRRRRVELAG